MKNQDYIVLTHNDADALGCIAVANRVFAPAKYFFTNYADLKPRFDELTKYCTKHRISNVVIADVSFSGNRKLIIDLTRMLARISHDYHLVVFDHHEYPENFWKGVSGEIHIDQSKSACKAMFDMYGLEHNLFEMTKFILDINAWDIYDASYPDFEEVLIFNEFIKIFCNGNTSKLVDLLDILTGYSPTYGYQYFIRQFCADYKNAFVNYRRDCLDKHVMIRSNKGRKITVLMAPEYFNMFVYTELNRNQDVVLCASNEVINVRIRKGAFSDAAIKQIKAELMPSNPTIGHPCAFPIMLASSKPDTVVDLLAQICEVFNKYQ